MLIKNNDNDDDFNVLITFIVIYVTTSNITSFFDITSNENNFSNKKSFFSKNSIFEKKNLF